MRHILLAALVLTAAAAAPVYGQGDGMGAGAGQGGAQGPARQRGGFGGGMPVQGIVTAAAADKITIQTEAGDTYTVSTTADTRLMRDRQPIKMADVKVGDGVTAMGTVDAAAKTVAAMMLMDVDAATVKQAKDGLGKTYITGKITAIDADNLKITVLRPDNVSQTIGVDEGTSFQRGPRGITVPSMFGAIGGGMRGGGMGGGQARPGGAAGQGAVPPVESITMADIKVGDTVVATGAVKGGVFTPVKMGVSQPMAAGAGRRRAAPADGPPAAPPQ